MLTATVSHEMRTPLNAIITLVQNLQRYINNPKGQKLLKVIQNSAKMLLSLVNDMLDIFQIKNGKFVKNEHELNLREALSQIEDLFKLASHEKGIDFKIFCDDSVP